VVELEPLPACGLDQLIEPVPEHRVDHFAGGGPLVGAVKDLAEDVVLALLFGRIAPAYGRRAPVAL
jgi:hypothetical protein